MSMAWVGMVTCRIGIGRSWDVGDFELKVAHELAAFSF
jgi:hypothetical protein